MATRKSARIASRESQLHKNLERLQQDDTLDFQLPDIQAASYSGNDMTDIDARPAKRRKTQLLVSPKPHRSPQTATTTQQQPRQTLFTNPPPPPPPENTFPIFPSRAHPLSYHHPLLLTSPSARTSLLTWYDKTSHTRRMPWRKPFTPPSQLTHDHLAQRAYEVWISEIMLQQTRVATVVAYWTRWMARWPTIRDLASAAEEEVLGMWAGLGYYARAKRVWLAAREICENHGGMLPGDVKGLMEGVPGVGRYTAGAIAAIVFGLPAAMVDGNVLRVLSRQMGVLGDVKGDRRVVEVLWEAAEALAKAVARDGEEGEGVQKEEEPKPSDRPGRWGQALMELGSTVCTPKPNCAACPITETCRAYAEGLALAEKGRRDARAEDGDIEDPCSLCAPFPEAVEQNEDEADPGEQEAKSDESRGKLSRFFAPAELAKAETAKASEIPDARTLEIVVSHARNFPLKKPKKQVREEETVVCAIRRSSDGRYLIRRRPEKGLLAGLWELPSHTLPKTNDSTSKSRQTEAITFVLGLFVERKRDAKSRGSCTIAFGNFEELGSVPWLFSHLKLTMHVHLFQVHDGAGTTEPGDRYRWASVAEIDKESMGTGMKKCWSLVKSRMK
ncbi:A/G-specific adenine DNA glycosylase [Achaetomium macrosporum]|uniref:Adenine DNA glycosylase n=1 Tax=Achaetomium macrosporum TaxID=79813 RepID=A0AAN7C5A8_9PEZI|nr:A/G-specific adenine DNA glycosylase [Achaetomium macrosporum]